MQKFKCGYCGSDSLKIAYDTCAIHSVKEFRKDYVIIPDEWEEIGDYMDTFYAFCGECHEEIYQGKHESSLIEHLKETGQLVEV